MANEILNSLLKEYEQKKRKAELDLEKRKEELYKNFPKLEQIEDELNHISISIATNLLLNITSSENLEEKSEKLKAQKAMLIKKANLPSNYLIPHYECSICNDTGYISENNYKTKMCNCLKQKLLDASFHKSNMANLDKENFNTFQENFFSDKVEPQKYHFDISPRENIKNIKQKCLEFVQNFDNPNTKNLLFIGHTGLR